MKHEQTYQLLARFFSLLEERGWKWGLGQQLRIQQLMARLPVPVSVDMLRDSLIAILATNKEEQEKLGRWFDEVLEEEPVKESLHLEEEEEEKKFNIRSLWWLPLLALIAVGLYFIIKPKPPVITDEPLEFFKTIQVDASDSASLCEEEVLLALQNELAQIQEVRLCSGKKDTIASFGALSITQTSCPLTYSAGPDTGLDSFCLEILGRNDTLLNLTLFVSVELPVRPDTQAVAPTLPTIDLPYDVDMADLAVEELGPGGQFLQDNLWWLKIAVLLLLAIILAIWLWWREYNRQKVIAKLGGNEKPPYFWSIKLDDIADSIDLGPTFTQLLNRLRQRQQSEIEELDVEKTIEQTAAQAGRFSFAYRARTKAPEYLLLIDKQGIRNHQSQLFDHIYHLFKDNEVAVARFFYKADPRKCYNEEFPSGISLSDLQRRYYAARLIVLGNGYQMLSSRTGRLASWTRLFEDWKERSLLSTQPSNIWGRREGQLSKLFVLLPASLRSIELLLEQLDIEGEADAELLRKKLSGIHEDAIEMEGGLIDTLQAHYSPAMMRWIAACAIFPTLHWDLTLYWGKYFSTAQDYLLESPKILSLTRLPWFVEGSIPNEARKVLLNWLEKEEKGLLVNLRGELLGILQQKQNQPPKDSVAFEEYRMSIALNQWLTTTDPKLKKELEDEIARLIEAGIEPDFAVAELQEKITDPSEFELPNQWKRLLYRGGMRKLGWQRWIKEGLAALSLLTLLGVGSIFIKAPVSQCEGRAVPYVDVARDTAYTLCLANARDSIIYFQQLARDTLLKPRPFLDPDEAFPIGAKVRINGSVVLDDIEYSLWAGQIMNTSNEENSYDIRTLEMVLDKIDWPILEERLEILDEDLFRLELISYFSSQVKRMNAADSVKQLFNHNVAAAVYNKAIRLKSDTARITPDSVFCAYFSLANELWGANNTIRSAYSDQLVSGCGEGGDEADPDCPIPDVQASLVLGDNAYFCAGEAVSIRNTTVGPNEFDYYLIDWGDGQIDSVSSFASLQHTYASDITSSTTVLIAGVKECPNGDRRDYVSLSVSISGYPSLIVDNPPDTVCVGQRFERDIQISGLGIGYELNHGDGTSTNGRIADASDDMILFHTYENAGEYTLTLRSENQCGESQSSILIVAEECTEDEVASVEEEETIDYEAYLPNFVNVQVIDQEEKRSWTRGLLIGEDESSLYVVTTEDSLDQRVSLSFPYFSPTFKDANLVRALGQGIYLFEVAKPENFVWNSNFEGVANQLENVGIIRYLGESSFSLLDPRPISKLRTKEFEFSNLDFPDGAITGSPAVNNSGVIGLYIGRIGMADGIPYGYRLSYIKERVTALGPKKYWGVNDNSNVTPNTPPPAEGSPEAGQYPLPQMVFIPGGSFQMGDPFDEGASREKPVHEVTVGGFFMSAHEVTFEQYDAFCEATNREKTNDRGWGRGKRPVIYVNWYDAIEYCNWLSSVSGYDPVYTIDKENKDPNNQSSFDNIKWSVTINEDANGFRLPTEAEWEYAARERGRKVRFGNGKDIADPAEMNFDASEAYKRPYSVVGEYRESTTEVGAFEPNSLGLYDMSGNVYEWCWDWYGENYYQQSDGANNPKGPSSGVSRVVRGGSWGNVPINCRASFRNYFKPYFEFNLIGFRIIRHQ
jgi:formylglycine-generating enzyme required for sulfatase activity